MIMKYEVVVIWNDGKKEIHECDTREKAENLEGCYKMVFAEQVWCCVREKR